jgi:hypothetical protein
MKNRAWDYFPDGNSLYEICAAGREKTRSKTSASWLRGRSDANHLDEFKQYQ